jgi:hypothetical protein
VILVKVVLDKEILAKAILAKAILAKAILVNKDPTRMVAKAAARVAKVVVPAVARAVKGAVRVVDFDKVPAPVVGGGHYCPRA